MRLAQFSRSAEVSGLIENSHILLWQNFNLTVRYSPRVIPNSDSATCCSTTLSDRDYVLCLHPWLQEEPNLQLELAFTNSLATAENLRFDTSVLDPLVDQFDNFCFKEVVIEHLIVRFSIWSAPAFSIEIRGLHITLSTREEEGRGSARKRKLRDGALEEMKNAILAIDPQGCALRDALERMLTTSSSRNSFKTSLLNLILKHCHLQILSGNLQFQFPIFNYSIAYWLEIKVLTAGS